MAHDYGNHVNVDKAEAFRHYKMAADQGYAIIAQNNVGYCYGVDVDKAEE
jgi:TPR repeat protein